MRRSPNQPRSIEVWNSPMPQAVPITGPPITDSHTSARSENRIPEGIIGPATKRAKAAPSISPTPSTGSLRAKGTSGSETSTPSSLDGSKAAPEAVIPVWLGAGLSLFISATPATEESMKPRVQDAWYREGTWRETSTKGFTIMSTILALDLGKFKSVCCFFHLDDDELRNVTVESTPPPSDRCSTRRRRKASPEQRRGTLAGAAPQIQRRMLGMAITLFIAIMARQLLICDREIVNSGVAVHLDEESHMRRLFLALLFCLPIAVGCNDSTAVREKPLPADRKVHIVAPGVNVDVEGKHDPDTPGKVKVTAPGVNVHVEKKPG